MKCLFYLFITRAADAHDSLPIIGYYGYLSSISFCFIGVSVFRNDYLNYAGRWIFGIFLRVLVHQRVEVYKPQE